MSNSNQPQSPSVGGTLTGGIQDISAILPIIGTDQCESHVGSALSGGYLYAGSAVLSIFGSLGIVKAGISVLISSITIPKSWVSDHDFRESAAKGQLKHSMVLGARMLKNSGFELQGDVAPLIGMDGTRFKAETKLIQIMEEKHIDNPEKVSIKWKSRDWNIMLILFTTVASAMSGIPYFALLLGQASWRPTTHLPWLFPFLRTAGSCFASVFCQFIIQTRVISLMKYRIMFMDIHRQLYDGFSKDNKDGLNNWIREHHLQWDPDLPAEQCILNLERFLASNVSASQTIDDVDIETGAHVSVEMENIATSSVSSRTSTFSTSSTSSQPLPPPPPPPPFNKNFKFDSNTLQDLRHKHFPSPTSDSIVILISWVILFLSLPTTVAGYVGCFTLVGASSGNGPLVWLGLEAALSIVRILIWAWNPLFDENTGITVELELTASDHPPMVTTANHNAFIHDSDNKNTKPFALVREREFLEWVTPFTGPLDQFRNPVNVALYFTLTADYSAIEDFGRKCTSLLLTVFDFNTRAGVTMLKLKGLFYYFDADVKYDTIYNEIMANLQLPMSDNHSWRMQDGGLFVSLEDYYNSVVRALNSRAKNEENIAIPERRWNPFRKATQDRIKKENLAILERRWNLFPKATQDQNLISSLSVPDLTNHDQLYLDRGYEHHLKTKLVEVWSSWIVENMGSRASDARNDYYEALTDETSAKAKWELTELDQLVGLEWIKRELVLLSSSIKLEDILRLKMDECITTVCKERKDVRLEQRMKSDFDVGRRKRLEKERGEAKKRMEAEMKKSGERAEREGRLWIEEERFAPRWREGIDFIDKKWSEGISRGPEALGNAESEVDRLAQIELYSFDGDVYKRRYDFMEQVKPRFAHWDSQRDNERQEMDAALDRIRRVDGQREQMDSTYKYPAADKKAPFKFVMLDDSSSKGKACSAIVYDMEDCSAEDVCDVIKKSTTRSVVDVDPEIVASIPPNDHLLFLSCYGEGEEPAFIQDNRDRWWDQQTTNSALFYFTPTGVDNDSCCVPSGPIAQIFVFLTTPSRVRLRLLHRAGSDFFISVEQKGETLHTLSDEIPKTLKLQNVELDEFGVGRNELQVVVARKPETKGGFYFLRDILIEFLTNDPAPVSASEDQADKIRPTIGAVSDVEEESCRSPNHNALPPPDALDALAEDHNGTHIFSEDREMEA